MLTTVRDLLIVAMVQSRLFMCYNDDDTAKPRTGPHALSHLLFFTVTVNNLKCF